MPTPVYESGGLLIPSSAGPRTFAARLRQSLKEFEAQLKETENFAIIAFVGGRAYAVEHIAVRGSELVVIDGPAEEDRRYRLLCHVGSMQLMLQVQPKPPHEKRRPIGFVWEEADETADETPVEEPAPSPAPAEAIGVTGTSASST